MVRGRVKKRKCKQIKREGKKGKIKKYFKWWEIEGWVGGGRFKQTSYEVWDKLWNSCYRMLGKFVLSPSLFHSQYYFHVLYVFSLDVVSREENIKRLSKETLSSSRSWTHSLKINPLWVSYYLESMSGGCWVFGLGWAGALAFPCSWSWDVGSGTAALGLYGCSYGREENQAGRKARSVHVAKET